MSNDTDQKWAIVRLSDNETVDEGESKHAELDALQALARFHYDSKTMYRIIVGGETHQEPITTVEAKAQCYDYLL